MDYSKLQLMKILDAISKIDPSYKEFEDKPYTQRLYEMRNNLIHDAVHLARKLNMVAGYITHEPAVELADGTWEPRYGVVAIIELPTGQVSWHMDSGGLKYDGHTNEDKYNRIDSFIKDIKQQGEDSSD